MQTLLIDIQSAAERAVSTSQFRPQGTLDYTISSFAIVEDMLDEANLYAADFSPEQVNAVVKDMGCYLLECAHVALGGRYGWFEERDQPVLVLGEPDYRLTLATWSKVRGRLMGERADHIPSHMNGFIERVRQAHKGDQVLFI